MPAWSSSSLAFSDHNSNRHSSGLLKNTPIRISKQHLTEQRMFGSKRKGIQIGKKFKKSLGSKGVIKSMKGLDKSGSLKSGGISPSLEEFDKMMSSIAKGSSKNGSSKKSMFQRKSFG